MRTEPIEAESFTIYDSPDICDPILVVMQDIAPGAGRLIVECYGSAWSGYWGAMGDRTLAQFLLSCDVSYIADRMAPQHGEPKAAAKWRRRVLDMVTSALYERTVQSGGA